jgi:hypothetical protein
MTGPRAGDLVGRKRLSFPDLKYELSNLLLRAINEHAK